MLSKKCNACGKSIYMNDPKLTISDGVCYHSSCARCQVCNMQLTIKNFSTSGDKLLCKTHFKEEFSKSGGCYAGDDKFAMKASRSMDSMEEEFSASKENTRPSNKVCCWFCYHKFTTVNTHVHSAQLPIKCMVWWWLHRCYILYYISVSKPVGFRAGKNWGTYSLPPQYNLESRQPFFFSLYYHNIYIKLSLRRT